MPGASNSAGRLPPLPEQSRESVRDVVGRRDSEFLEWLDEDGALGPDTFTKMQSPLMDEVLDSMGPDHVPTRRSMDVEGLSDITGTHKAQLLGQ